MVHLPGSLPSSGHWSGPETSTLPYFIGIFGPLASWNSQGSGQWQCLLTIAHSQSWSTKTQRTTSAAVAAASWNKSAYVTPEYLSLIGWRSFNASTSPEMTVHQAILLSTKCRNYQSSTIIPALAACFSSTSNLKLPLAPPLVGHSSIFLL